MEDTRWIMCRTVASNREVTAGLYFRGAAGRAEATEEIDFVPHILPSRSGARSPASEGGPTHNAGSFRNDIRSRPECYDASGI